MPTEEEFSGQIIRLELSNGQFRVSETLHREAHLQSRTITWLGSFRKTDPRVRVSDRSTYVRRGFENLLHAHVGWEEDAKQVNEASPKYRQAWKIL